MNPTRLMRIASIVAEESFATRLKVGCVITKNGRILASGYNGTPTGMDNTCEGEDGKTLSLVLHAEENALMFCLREGISTMDSEIYITDSPCMQCAKLILNAGIATVYYQNPYRDENPIKFLASQGIGIYQIPTDTCPLCYGSRKYGVCKCSSLQ